jgi:site-specific recombinase XerD
VGLRDGALLALLAVGITREELPGLQASAVTMERGDLIVHIRREAAAWSVILPSHLGARLLAWLTESRLWAAETPMFETRWGPLTQFAIYKLFHRYARQGGRCRGGRRSIS